MPQTTGLGNYAENKDELVSHNFDIFQMEVLKKQWKRGMNKKYIQQQD